MNILFATDGPLFLYNEEEYYGVSLNNDLFNRYKLISENLSIAIRVNRSCEYKDIEKKEKLNTSDVNIIDIPNVANVKEFLFNKQAKRIINEAVKKSDAIIVRIPSIIGNITIESAKRYNKPYLIEVVGCSWDSLWNHSIKGKLAAPYMFLKMKSLVHNAPYVIYVSEEFLPNRYPNKNINVKCTDVFLKEFNSNVIEKKKKNNSELCSKEEIIFGSIGAISVKYKGMDLVIKALSELNKEGHNFKYQIVGEGERAYLESVIEKYNASSFVELKGSLEHKDIFDWLDNIDIYIQASKAEGLPRALIEAMSRGCICLGSNAGGIPELLNEEYIFKKGDYKAIKETIKKLNKNNFNYPIEDSFNKILKFDKTKVEPTRKRFLERFITEK